MGFFFRNGLFFRINMNHNIENRKYLYISKYIYVYQKFPIITDVFCMISIIYFSDACSYKSIKISFNFCAFSSEFFDDISVRLALCLNWKYTRTLNIIKSTFMESFKQYQTSFKKINISIFTPITYQKYQSLWSNFSFYFISLICKPVSLIKRLIF